MELNSQTNESTEPSNNSLSDFEQRVEESKQALASEPLKAPRRGRGRPKKSADQAPQTQPTAINEPQTTAPQIEIAKFLEVPLQALSKIPANNHKIPELALTSEEAQQCALALDGIFQAFVPNINQMSPKTAAIISAFAVFGSIGFTKYQIYLEKKPPSEPPKTEIQQVNAELTQIDASNYFKK